MRTPSWPFWAVSVALAGVGTVSLAVGGLALFAWIFDGMDPATQFSAKYWRVPMAVGGGLLLPVTCVAAWAYTAWCAQLVRSLFATPDPITLDRGWSSKTT